MFRELRQRARRIHWQISNRLAGLRKIKTDSLCCYPVVRTTILCLGTLLCFSDVWAPVGVFAAAYALLIEVRHGR